jgi:hypothetical protein
LRQILEENNMIIERLKTYRDENLAHEDKKKTEVTITIEEIDKLFEIAKEILNTLSYKINFDTTEYDHIEKYIKKDIEKIIKSLG